MNISQSLENQFLLAMPSMRDPRFVDSVSLVCQHNDEGAIALVINKPITQSLQEVFLQMQLSIENLDNPEQLILSGGPVQPEAGFVLHACKGEWEATLVISDQLFLTSSADILEAISQGSGPKEYLFLLGYAGWTAGQLEMELEQNAWFHQPVSHDTLFDTPPERIANKVIQESGIDLSRISTHVGHA